MGLLGAGRIFLRVYVFGQGIWGRGFNMLALFFFF